MKARGTGDNVQVRAAPAHALRRTDRRLNYLHISEVPVSHNAASLTERLLENEEYRRLHEQHHEYEARLSQFHDQAVLSDDEQVDDTTRKKKKLQLKDRIEAIAPRM